MKSGSPCKRGTGIVEKLIATVALLITIVAMVVIIRLPNDYFIKVSEAKVEGRQLSDATAQEMKATMTSSKPISSTKVPSAEEARVENRSIYMASAALEVTTKAIKEEAKIGYKTEVINTFALKKGESKVIRKGQEGLKEVNKKLTYKGETLKDTEVTSKKTVKKPVSQVVLEGTDSAAPVFMTPASGRYSSYYGERWNRMHKGVDIAAPIGTPIKAAEGGEITFSGTKGGFGKCIIVKHKNGYETVYGHISKLIGKTGDKVNKGEVIAEVGNTGRSTGPHLHFEVKVNGKNTDPMNYLKK